jgi:hypothetical protein
MKIVRFLTVRQVKPATEQRKIVPGQAGDFACLLLQRFMGDVFQNEEF